MGLYWSASAPNYTKKYRAHAAEGPAAGRAARLLHQNTPQKIECAAAVRITTHDYARLRIVRIIGMAPPPFFHGPGPPFCFSGALMLGASADCVPKALVLH